MSVVSYDAREQRLALFSQRVEQYRSADPAHLTTAAHEPFALELLEVPAQRVRREAELRAELRGGDGLCLLDRDQHVAANTAKSRKRWGDREHGEKNTLDSSLLQRKC